MKHPASQNVGLEENLKCRNPSNVHSVCCRHPKRGEKTGTSWRGTGNQWWRMVEDGGGYARSKLPPLRITIFVQSGSYVSIGIAGTDNEDVL
ncbi:U4/U6 small nuclear ribonucleoprotein prp4 [Hypoxylon texense]